MKRRVSGEEFKRSHVSANCRTGRRWVTLTGRSPLLAFVFSPIADTIVYVPVRSPLFKTHDFQRQNNSITELTIKKLARSVKHNHPELVRVLMEVGTYAGLISSRIAPTMPRVEDVVVKTHQLLISVGQTVPPALKTNGSDEGT